jgi:hypothetical protein
VRGRRIEGAVCRRACDNASAVEDEIRSEATEGRGKVAGAVRANDSVEGQRHRAKLLPFHRIQERPGLASGLLLLALERKEGQMKSGSSGRVAAQDAKSVPSPVPLAPLILILSLGHLYRGHVSADTSFDIRKGPPALR